MRSKGIVLAALAAVVIGMTALVMVGLRDPAARPDRPVWPTGSRHDYRLEWQTRSEVASSDDAGLPKFGSRTDLAARLRFTSHGPHEGGWLLAATFVDVTKPDVEVLGNPVFANADAATAQLVGPIAWVVLDRDGGVDRMYFEAAAPQAFKHLMQSVIGLARITSGDDESWRATEPGPSGIGRVEYHRDDATRWTRARVGYDTITAAPAIAGASPDLVARAAITVDASGHLATLVDDESLTVRLPGVATPLFRGTSRFALTLIETGDDSVRPAPALAALEARTPGELVQGGDVEHSLRTQRAAGLTREELAGGLRRAWGESRGERRRWMHRAVALLQLQPELCAEVVEIFGAGEPSVKLLAFDLLAAAGNTEAQAAMREAFQSPAAAGLEVALMQRFSFIKRPDPESARFVATTWQSTTDRNLAAATSYSVGAVARHLQEGGKHEAVAVELNTRLRESLAKATTVTEREHLLAAIGNTALAENVPLLREHARDRAPEVRERAAWALRDMATAEALVALHELSADADARVARSALKAMGRQTLGAADLERLASAMTGDHVAEATLAALVDLLSHHLESGAVVRRMLEAIVARPATNPNLQARARVLLAQL